MVVDEVDRLVDVLSKHAPPKEVEKRKRHARPIAALLERVLQSSPDVQVKMRCFLFSIKPYSLLFIELKRVCYVGLFFQVVWFVPKMGCSCFSFCFFLASRLAGLKIRMQNLDYVGKGCPERSPGVKPHAT